VAVTGKKAAFKQIMAEQSAQRFVSLSFPPGAGTDTVEFFNEFGCT
jgi:hypothetical protein